MKILKKILKFSMAPIIFIGIFLLFKFFWNFSDSTIENSLNSSGTAGAEIAKDFFAPKGEFIDSQEGFILGDSLNGFPAIKTAQAKEKEEDIEEPQMEEGLKIVLPKDYKNSLEIKLNEQRSIAIVHKGAEEFLSESTGVLPEKFLEESRDDAKIFTRYKSIDGRKEIYYTYKSQDANRILKNWILYKKGNGKEEEHYEIKNSIIRKNVNGEIEVYYFGDQDEENQEIVKKVDQHLLMRAQLSVANDMREDIEKNGGTPDFIIPRPYFVDSSGNKTDLEWEINQEKSEIEVSFAVEKKQYPLALDPTLFFTASGQSANRNVIQGQTTSNTFGRSLAAGDINFDGIDDLIVAATGYSTNTGRVYIFYGGKAIEYSSANADVIITGEATNNYFGYFPKTGDFNLDGRTDLAIGAYGYSSSTGRMYVFYNDGSIPTAAASADVIITGESTSHNFGHSLSVGDFNSDGNDDLVVGANGVSTSTGKIYIFYGDGSIPTVAASADLIISGESTSNQFGYFSTIGDFDGDSDDDLAVTAYSYSSSTGRVYVFYSDGSIPTAAASADVIITGEGVTNYFGYSLATGDFDSDGNDDLVVGAYGYSTSTGRTYIFYSDGSIPTAAGSADVKIIGEASSNNFGYYLLTDDFNADGKDDLVVGASGYSTSTGRVYIFYNDGSITSLASTADVIITGEATSTSFGIFLTAGDFNDDGKIDLAVGASSFSTSTGRAYIFYSNNGVYDSNSNLTGNFSETLGYSLAVGDFDDDGKSDLVVGNPYYMSNTGKIYIFYNDGSFPTESDFADIIITGEAVSSSFGANIAIGDFDLDGNDDLAIGAYRYTTYTGRTYLFYSDGSIPTAAASADGIITGEGVNNYFGYSLATGDFDSDGDDDLAVGAYGYSSSTGRTYLFYSDGSIPTAAASADVIITGEATSSYFGYSLTTGDFDSDGDDDLAVGTCGYSSGTGRAYIFYSDGSIPTVAASADVIITGEATSNYFSSSLATGDFDFDGDDDLAVGAYLYSSSTGRAYIFYSDGSIPTAAASADVIITGEATSNYFGYSLATGDFDSDGDDDLAVGAYLYSSSTGRTYIFYSDGSIPTVAASADAIITGEATSDKFSYSLAVGDFNADGNGDLITSSVAYQTNAGRIYIFYNDGSIPTTAASADLIISGKSPTSYFGYSMAVGDFNSDNNNDLAVGAFENNSNTGQVYIFYNDGSIPDVTGDADVVIIGEASSNNFGQSLIVNDFNSDGIDDLVVGANRYNSYDGRAYIFYSDGSIPTTAASADVIIDGQATGSNFGISLTKGDINSDGTDDLIIGANEHNSNTGRVYIFYNDGSIPSVASSADIIIDGQAISNYFGYSLATGDFDSDGDDDLAIGAYRYTTYTGRAYIFYNDGSIPTAAANADVIITGQATSDSFGFSLTTGDFDSDGDDDLVVGACGYSTSTGRAYIFYSDGSIPTAAASADVIITGQTTYNYFGYSLAVGDFNSDGRDDLAVGAPRYNNSYTGRTYIFYNDGSISTTAGTGDIIVNGDMINGYFGRSLLSGDFNGDGSVDLAIGTDYYEAERVYFLLTTIGFINDNPAKFKGNAKLNGNVRFR